MTRAWPHFLLALAVVFIAVAPAILGSFTITLMNYIGVYSFAALGLVLLTGVGGLTSFGQAAFVGIGAYATAWYTAQLEGIVRRAPEQYWWLHRRWKDNRPAKKKERVAA